MSMALEACWSSPADRAGQVDDLLSRIERIETILAQLGLSDVQANQLADISRDAGHLTNLIATASNAAGGWITDGTFTGVGISTLGWLMSDGNPYPIVQMVDGVLQYGFSTDASQATLSTSGRYVGGGVVVDNPSVAGTVEYPWSTTPPLIPATGRYLLIMECRVQYITSASAATGNFYLTTTGTDIKASHAWTIPASASTSDYHFTTSQVYSLNAGTRVRMKSTTTNFGAGSYLDYGAISIIRV